MEGGFLSKKKLSPKLIFLILGIFTLINAGLHFYRISYPNSPVFDEKHFATYAADYIKQKAYFDIHPPLGKVIYAAALFVFGGPAAGNADFISVQRSKNNDSLITKINEDSYGNFPYVLLRTVAVIFGLLLPLVFFWFLKSIGIGDVASLFGAGILILDNAMLLETRLILMNGMYLTFGLAALALFFQKPPKAVFAGIIFGLALSVKLIAFSLLGPLVLVFLFDYIKEAKKNILKFLIAAASVFFVVCAFGFAWFPFKDQVNALASVIPGKNLPGLLSSGTGSSPGSKMSVFLAGLDYSFGGYVAGAVSHPSASRWFFWPIGQKAMDYDYLGSKLVLIPNYAIWWAALLAVILSIAILPRYAIKYFKKIKESGHNKLDQIPFLLLAGYIFALHPYFAFVNRVTFLYHYFPALLFGIGLLVWMIEKKSKNWAPIIIFSILFLVGFIYGAGCVYGFYCNPIAFF